MLRFSEMSTTVAQHYAVFTSYLLSYPEIVSELRVDTHMTSGDAHNHLDFSMNR